MFCCFRSDDTYDTLSVLKITNERLSKELEQIKSLHQSLQRENDELHIMKNGLEAKLNDLEETNMEILHEEDVLSQELALKDKTLFELQSNLKQTKDKLSQEEKDLEYVVISINDAVRAKDKYKKKSDHFQQALILLGNVVDDLQQSQDTNVSMSAVSLRQSLNELRSVNSISSS
uniref:Uncharacterized protein n=1 Tax=Polytomella parva TaxID=51329 RepID=A0A7S0YHG3_9CHLO|mmetsp:Transcript_20034/g.36025  ORF Transcript_20034/g.36025 Transcript_20034/m.36025 type:complete len:175 (+) Transcript_20034:146-670(+)